MLAPRSVLLSLASGLLAIAIFVSGCSSSDPVDSASETTSGDDQTTTGQATTTAEPTTVKDSSADEESSVGESPEPGLLAAKGTRSNWSGTIGDGIEFSMWLAQQDRFLRGEITYASVGQPITVLGTHDPEGEFYVLREFGPDGRVSGTLSFNDPAAGAVIDGQWFGASDDLQLTANFDGVDDQVYFFDPLVRSGDYGYSYPPFSDADECCGPVGNLMLADLGDGTASVEFQNVRGGPSFNQALFGPTTIAVTDNRILFDGQADSIYEDCAFEITVFDGFAFVEHIDERYDCAFGNAAGIAGAYLLIG